MIENKFERENPPATAVSFEVKLAFEGVVD
jgi:hypothetical protein